MFCWKDYINFILIICRVSLLFNLVSFLRNQTFKSTIAFTNCSKKHLHLTASIFKIREFLPFSELKIRGVSRFLFSGRIFIFFSGIVLRLTTRIISGNHSVAWTLVEFSSATFLSLPLRYNLLISLYPILLYIYSFINLDTVWLQGMAFQSNQDKRKS